MSDVVVSTGKRIECPLCSEVGNFGLDITEDMLPIRLACTGCSTVLTITEASKHLYKRMPKIVGTRPSVVAFVRAPEEKLPEPEPAAKPVAVAKKSDRPPSFHDQMEECSATFLSALHQAEEIRLQIAKLSEGIAEQMDRMLGESQAILSWNPRLIYHFLMNPVGALPAGCLDPTIDKRTKYLLCPKFYPRLHGFPIGLHGGFYLQAITPYSQLAFPLERHLSDELEIPIGTQLRIAGDKVIGPGLHKEWVHVEGTVPDEDHRITNPSLLVKDMRRVRQWIAKNGGKPWDNLMIEKEFFPYHSEMLEADCDLEAVKRFRMTFPVQGRTIICWQNVEFARMTVAVTGHGIRTTKLIVSDGPMRNWHEGFKLELEDRRLFTHCTTQNYMDYMRFSGPGSVGLLIVDASDAMPPLEFWEELYDYAGPLIILLREPFLDTFDENVLASTIYGLCNSISMVPDQDAWRKAWRSYEKNPPESIQRVFDSIRLRFGNT